MSKSSSYKRVGEVYKSPYNFDTAIREDFVVSKPVILEDKMKEEYIKKEQVEDTLELEYKADTYSNTSSPDVWGPSFWFTLHNGAIKYPLNASPIWAERMKGFILGMQVMIPCEKCADHAISYIESNYDRLDDIVSGRDKLFKFFVDFHNKVNERYGKAVMNYEDAYRLYSGRARVLRMQYK